MLLVITFVIMATAAWFLVNEGRTLTQKIFFIAFAAGLIFWLNTDYSANFRAQFMSWLSSFGIKLE